MTRHIIKASDVFNFYVLPLLGFGLSSHVIIPLGRQLVQVSLLDVAMSRKEEDQFLQDLLVKRKRNFPSSPLPLHISWARRGSILLNQEKEITIVAN